MKALSFDQAFIRLLWTLCSTKVDIRLPSLSLQNPVCLRILLSRLGESPPTLAIWPPAIWLNSSSPLPLISYHPSLPLARILLSQYSKNPLYSLVIFYSLTPSLLFGCKFHLSLLELKLSLLSFTTKPHYSSFPWIKSILSSLTSCMHSSFIFSHTPWLSECGRRSTCQCS